MIGSSFEKTVSELRSVVTPLKAQLREVTEKIIDKKVEIDACARSVEEFKAHFELERAEAGTQRGAGIRKELDALEKKKEYLVAEIEPIESQISAAAQAEAKKRYDYLFAEREKLQKALKAAIAEDEEAHRAWRIADSEFDKYRINEAPPPNAPTYETKSRTPAADYYLGLKNYRSKCDKLKDESVKALERLEKARRKYAEFDRWVSQKVWELQVDPQTFEKMRHRSDWLTELKEQ